VKVHVRNIMRKLKAKNRTQVAYMTKQLDVGLETIR
jgi:DNA-binding NarL/FixJ family response regulator